MGSELELLAFTDIVKHRALDYFENVGARDGAFLSIVQLYEMITELTHTEIREAVDALRPEQDLLEIGREAGLKVVYYRPLSPYKAALRMCHQEAAPNGTVPTLRVKLLLQAFVFLDSMSRIEMLRELEADHLRAVKIGTMRRAQVDQMLHDSLKTFNVA